MAGDDGLAGASDIAIVGMAARVPGAHGGEALWRLALSGRTAIEPRSDEQLLAAGVAPVRLDDPDYVRWAGVIDGVECFDAGFFEIGPRDAAIMDPQHRHFLQCAWEALEHAGHPPAAFAGAIGVFAGCGWNGYLTHNLLTNPQLVSSAGMFLLRHTANDKDFLSTYVSYLLDLKGPSVNVQTACSTSLVAIHLAAQSLLGGECDMALAGGVTIEVPHGVGYTYHEGEILSPDGHCRAFDARSEGTVLTSGAGVVVLRRLADAVADGDTVYAVIKASAVNNDGAGKVGYLAPSVDGHAAVVAEALAIAGLSGDQIGYLEAHGTGTRVGDPIEVAALTEAFRQTTRRRGYCRLGSTKPSIGHLDTAAGVASVIKATGALRAKTLPPLANFTAPNPLIDFAATPFVVSGEAAPWTADGEPRRAGVSSLGVGGTNAHVILEEGPEAAPVAAPRPRQLLVLSAKTEGALDRASGRLARHLREHPDADLADVAWTLQVGRAPFAHRRVLVAEHGEAAAALLEATDAKAVISGKAEDGTPSVVFMFPGGGAQSPGMGRDLYASEPVYRAEIDRCLALLEPEVREEIRGLLFPSAGEEECAAKALEMPSAQLPAILMTEYALAKLWMSWGVRPAALTGHSLGEYAAATLAGVISLADALSIVRLRGQLMERVPDAAMLSVALDEEALRGRLGDDLSLATVNAPGLGVVSGKTAAIGRLEAELAAEEIEHRRIKIVGAVHSALLDPYLDEFAERLKGVRFSPPQIPFISNLTGGWADAAEVQTPAYWVRHLRHTVRFADGMTTLLAEPGRILVEIGPGTNLTALARAQAGRPRAAINALPHPRDPVAEGTHALRALGRAWIAGAAVDWAAFSGPGRRRVALPTYPFERIPHWIAPGQGADASRGGDLAKLPEIGDWFSRPVWQRADLPAMPSTAVNARWLVFLDRGPFGAALVERLRGLGQAVITVRAGERWGQRGEESFAINPEDKTEYDRLVAQLAAAGATPDHIVHCWSLNPPEETTPLARAEAAGRWGFYSLLALAQALGGADLDRPVQLTVVTAGMQRVDGEPARRPEQATVLGPVRVIPKEIVGVGARSIDLYLPAERRTRLGKPRPGADTVPVLVERLVEECLSGAADATVAFRRGRRWVQAYDAASLPAEIAPGAGLREGGVYLITGGTGGIGLALAEHLAAISRAKLVLVSRSPFALPERGEWEAWAERHGDDHPTSRRIAAVRRIEAAGGEVLVAQADVAEPEQMRRLVLDVKARFGTLNGVFHAAGVLDDGLIQLKAKAQAAAVLRPKVAGTLALAEALADVPLDFLVLFSSTSALLGIEGQVDYAAANAFLNAYAASRAGGPGPYVVAVDWGVWREVGLAARAARGEPSGAAAPAAPAVHPLLGAPVTVGATDPIYSAVYDTDALWVLDEHRLAGGTALLPGTGFLEIARAAMQAAGPRAEQAEGYAVEIRHLYFLAPLEVPDSAPLAVRVALTGSERGRQVTVSSNAGGAGRATGWQDHATGELYGVTVEPPAPREIEAIARRCTRERTVYAAGAQETRQERYLRFGPRWKVLRQVDLGEGEALARLALQPEFVGDLDVYRLHPALLDLATGFALPLLPGYAAGEGLYVPMSYRCVRVHQPLRGQIVSHAVLRGDVDAASEVIAFDVTIIAEDGTVLVEVEEFSMRRLGDPATLLAETRPAVGTVALPEPVEGGGRAEGGARRAPAAYRSGILPDEGFAALSRVLAGRRLPEVVVSSVSLAGLMRDVAARARAAEEGPSTKVARPEGGAEYAGPRDAVEQTLVEAWETLLGIERVGIHDNFFDLGGHSLIAVRLFSRLKKAYGVDLGLAVLFEAPTIAEIAAIIRGGPPGEATAATPVVVEGGVAVEEQPPGRTRWTSLVPIQTGGGRPPFFCIHGAGGNVLNFRRIAARLGDDQPFYGLQAYGLDGGGALHTRIEQMAAHYLSEIRQVQPEGPYLLGGYSGGGLVAAEMVGQLRAAGQEVAVLAFIDSFCPGALGERASYRDVSKLQKLLMVARTTRESGLPYLAKWAQGQATRRLRRLPGISTGDTDWDMERTYEDAFLEAMAGYTLRPFDAPVVLFRARVQADAQAVPFDLGWSPYALGGVEVHEAPGNHWNLLDEPNVSVLAAALRTALDRAVGARAVGVAGD